VSAHTRALSRAKFIFKYSEGEKGLGRTAKTKVSLLSGSKVKRGF